MRDRYRYIGMGRRYVTDTRLPALVIGAVTAWEGKRMTVVHVEERGEVDGGKWVVHLDPGDGGKTFALSASSVEATPPSGHQWFETDLAREVGFVEAMDILRKHGARLIAPARPALDPEVTTPARVQSPEATS